MTAAPGLAQYRHRPLGCKDDAHAFIRVPGERAWECRRCGVRDPFHADDVEAGP